MEGGFLSTLFPPTGPAQLPARSHTEREPVSALAVSLPSGTEVASENDASAGLRSPEPPASDAVQGIVTFAADHWPLALAQVIVGAVRSILTVSDLAASTLPALSSAKKEIVVTPDAVTAKLVVGPSTTVDAIVCAPVALNVMRRTPDPPASSLAFKVTVTFELVQPEAGLGERTPLVDGGVASVAPGCTTTPFTRTVSVAPASMVTFPLSGP